MRGLALLLAFVPCLSMAQDDVPWTHATTIYQVYPRSFQDSDGDGIGDIQGIIDRLDHIQRLGFETIWCSPFFDSPQDDFGYDIRDQRAIAPEYGDLSDALRLIDSVHARGMRIVFDMVLNHTSIEHPWFQADLERPPGEPTFYVWRDEPTRWKSMVTGNAWTYRPERDQYYYAAFLPFQPDLNYRNPAVRRAMLGHVRYWLEQGVDGYRLDIFNYVYEDSLFRRNMGPFRHTRSADQPESVALARDLRALVDSFGPRMLLGEVVGGRETARTYLGGATNDGLTGVFEFELLRFRFSARYFRKQIAEIEAAFPPPFAPVYVFSNHDRRRSMERLDGDVRKAKLLHLLQFTLRGSACLYYGEEIGMRDLRMPYRQALDPVTHRIKIPRFLVELVDETINRDEVRTPMQWTGGHQAGFSTADSTWLPVHPNHETVNVADQAADASSLMHHIRTVLHLRRDYEALRTGTLRLLPEQILPDDVLGYERIGDGETITVFLNMGVLDRTFTWPNRACRQLLTIHPTDGLNGSTVHLSGDGAVVVLSY